MPPSFLALNHISPNATYATAPPLENARAHLANVALALAIIGGFSMALATIVAEKSDIGPRHAGRDAGPRVIY